MRQELILAPMGAQALLTFLVLAVVPLRRFRAAFARQVTAADFSYGESPSVPGEVALANRNYMNLLELPVLFYVICLLYYVTGRVETDALMLAWGFVAARVLHSLVHLFYNNVYHRLGLFAAGVLLLIALWALLFARLF
jgi:hypothetical protein